MLQIRYSPISLAKVDNQPLPPIDNDDPGSGSGE